MQLRSFTKFDWYGFAGAEGDNPLISDGNRATTIVDDNGIQVIGCMRGDEPEPDMLAGCWNLSCTRLVAEAIAEKLDDSRLTPAYLKKFGFERID